MKAVCMLLVYINHSEIYFGLSCDWFGYLYRPIFVNSFFFLSGYLLLRKLWPERKDKFDIKEMVSLTYKNVYKLFIPTIIFSFVFYFPKKIIRGEIIDLQSLLCDTIGGGSIWFTAALFIAQILLFILLLSNSRIVCLLGALFLWGLAAILFDYHFTIFGSETMPWYYKSGMQAVVLLIAGGVFAKYEATYCMHMQKYKWMPASLLVCYIVLALSFHSEIRTALDWQVLNILGFAVSIIGILSLKEIVDHISSYRIINYIGHHSIGFYFFCGSIVNVIAIIGRRVLPYNYVSILVIAFSAYLVSLLLVWLINKYLPFLYDFRLIKSR